jgi:hypothetical protein
MSRLEMTGSISTRLRQIAAAGNGQNRTDIDRYIDEAGRQAEGYGLVVNEGNTKI